MKDAEQEIDRIYDSNEGSESVEGYHSLHEIQSLAILTICSPYEATREVDQFAHRIRGKTVIEIGAGVGFLAMEMARFAKRVYAIEADPAWTWVFTECLYQKKSPNLTWIFGTAESVSDWLRGDVAVIYTRSGIKAMEAQAAKMCPIAIFGPVLEFDELHSDVPEEIRQEAIREATIAAGNLTQADITGRRRQNQ